MFHHRSWRKLALLPCLALLLSLLSVPQRAAAYPVVTLWHAWHEPEAALLKSLAEEYGQADVQLTTFKSEQELFDALRSAATQGGGPDLFLGPGGWAATLHDMGLIAAGCQPEGCNSKDGEFAGRRNSDFQIAGLCGPDGCEPCSGDDAPAWCWAAKLDRREAPDLFQAGLAVDGEEGIFSLGLPLAWDFVAVAANTEWFVEKDLAPPASLKEILAAAEQHQGYLYIEPSLLGGAASDSIGWFIEAAAKGDPTPQPNLAAIHVFPAARFHLLYAEVQSLVLLPLEDYQPQPEVQALYVGAKVDSQSPALDFAARIGDPANQTALYKQAGRLPAADAAWSQVADEALVRFGNQSWLAFVGGLFVPDFRDTVQWPEWSPELGDDYCSNAAERLHIELIDHYGGDRKAVVRGAGDAVTFRSLCWRYLAQVEAELGLGSDRCSHEARETFARRLSELYGSSGAVDRARDEAAEALRVCRGG